MTDLDAKVQALRDGSELIREYLKLWNRAKEDTNDAEDDAYNMGLRDGFESVVQMFDLATGGDGEFVGSSLPGGTVDVPVMIERTLERFALIDALQARLAEVERETVERCAKVCDEIQETNGDESFLPEICAAAIRALNSDAPANPSAL